MKNWSSRNVQLVLGVILGLLSAIGFIVYMPDFVLPVLAVVAGLVSFGMIGEALDGDNAKNTPAEGE